MFHTEDIIAVRQTVVLTGKSYCKDSGTTSKMANITANITGTTENLGWLEYPQMKLMPVHYKAIAVYLTFAGRLNFVHT